MHGVCGLMLLLLLLLLGALALAGGGGGADEARLAGASEAKAGKARGQASGWRVLVALAQAQPSRLEVQRAWDEALRELAHLEVQLAWVEGPQPRQQQPTALLGAFCAEVRQPRSVLLLVLGGGAAARFLLTAAAALDVASLWMPLGHRDFARQGRERSLESRIGSGSAEMGAAAGALMLRAHWHAFSLLLDPQLMPLEDLPLGGELLARSIVYLPAEERKLSARLRRLSEENGRGSVIVLACDLANARKVMQLAGRHDMLAGRFLWLWLDLKAELRPGEPTVARPPTISPPTQPLQSSDPFEQRQEVPARALDGLAHDLDGLQGWQWRWQADRQPPRAREEEREREQEEDRRMPVGMLALRAAGPGPEALLGRGLREAAQALERGLLEARGRLARMPEADCEAPRARGNASRALAARLREHARRASRDSAEFQLLNLQAWGGSTGNRSGQARWRPVGLVRAGREVRLETISWPGGGIVPAYAQRGRERLGLPRYRVVTALSPPFAMVVDLQEGACLRGLVCRHGSARRCCFGYSMDLLRQVAQDLDFGFELHVARDGLFGRRRGRNGTWNGIVGELVSGRAQLAFAALSVYSHRSQVIDFSTPYYFGSVSLLIAPKERNHISLLAFLQPFSTELWIAVFTSLNITAMFVAAYEWFSPFGLNPWGRQRSKNFSIASALWVMWGLLCGHLVAFKAPKSWPNKFLINVWGGFSVIFVASYTANIAALIAGLFFHSTDNNYKSRSLLLQRVAAPKASAAEFYVQQADPRLWSYMSRFSVLDVADGVQRLLNDSLDVLIADTPIVDYYRATDNGCRLEKIGDSIKEDTYAVGLTRGHPLRESISRVIANYSATGLLDILQEKWYGGLPCLHGAASGIGFDGQPHHGGQPRPLGVASVAGVFCLLGLGMSLGVLILLAEHIFYKYSLPKLRQCPKNSIWRSRNVMFFSQKLYRFINCVELVSPHHAARELVHTVRQGQITSLFQKSVKRKEHEQRRRRKSKAQFFEMIQEIRKAQQEHRAEAAATANAAAAAGASASSQRDQSRGAIPKEQPTAERGRSRSRSRSKSPRCPDRSRSAASLASPRRDFTLSSSNLRARSPLELVGRRLSHGDGGSPPPTPSPRALSAARSSLGPRAAEPARPPEPEPEIQLQEQQDQPQPQALPRERRRRTPQPARRARSHDNDEARPRAARQLESELKAILAARAHHLQLQPP